MKTKRHVLNKKDSTLKTLASYANRISKLLETAHSAANVELEGALDDLLGAVYALIAAREAGFKGKLGGSEFAVALDRAKDAARRVIYDDGNWIAGFHFNSAIFRISAVFDRLPKAIACCSVAAANSYRTKTGRTWKKSNAHAIRKQVNILKHAAGGTYQGREAKLKTALSAISELLSLAEASCEAVSDGALSQGD